MIDRQKLSVVVPAPFLFALNKPTGRKTGKGKDMENNNTTTQQEGAQQTTGAAGQAQQGADQQPSQGQQDKLFTQADVDRIVGNRLARMKQDLETSDTYRRERDDARRELEEYKNNAFLKEKGVKEADMDYIKFKARQLMNDKTDFEQAAGRFLQSNPQFTGRGGFRVVSTGTPDGSARGCKTGASDAEIRRAMGLKG